MWPERGQDVFARDLDHVAGAAGRLRQQVRAAFHYRGMHETVAYVWDVLKKPCVVARCGRIEQHQMLVDLAHVAHMRHNREPELPREQADGQKFRDTRQPRTIRLHEVQRARLHEILEHYAVWHVLAERNSNEHDTGTST